MNSNERAEIHGGIAWAMVFALAAVVMGIVAIAHKCPRYNLDFDYLGLLVGILSLLVTTLLGWNIYQVIDLKRAKQEIADIHNTTRIYIDRLHINLYSTAVGVCKNAVNSDDKRHIKVLMVKNHLFLIFHELRQRNMDVAEASIKSLFDELKKHGSIIVTEYEMKTLSAIEAEVMQISSALKFEPGMQIFKMYDYIKVDNTIQG